MASSLRFVSYLAPSLPEGLWRLLAEQVGTALGVAVTLRFETGASGPSPADAGPDPFSAGAADVGFLCAPPFLWLRARRPPPVELVPAGLVFDDPRALGAPVYFADVVVARSAAATRFADLRGQIWAYNDLCSLSGYRCLLGKMEALGAGGPFFARTSPSGSHLASLAWVAEGRAGAAAIDSNVLRLALRRDPSLGQRIRVLESWGPYPIQPLCVRAGLDLGLRRALAPALLSLGREPALRAALAGFGLRGLVPVDETLYASEWAELGGPEHAPQGGVEGRP